MSCNGFLPDPSGPARIPLGRPRTAGRTAPPVARGWPGQAHTCGALLFTGAQIRAATNEPIPDPKSPGLNLSQVDSALRSLSNGVIDLDTRYALAFDTYRAKLTAGSQAILQIQRSELIKAGQGYGNTFPGGHAIHTGAENGVPWFDDPLTGRHVTTWATLEKAAGALLFPNGTHLGFGKVYAAFTRDITQTYRATCRPLPGQTYRTFTRYFVNAAGRITTHEIRRTKGFRSPARPRACSRPRAATSVTPATRRTPCGGCRWSRSRSPARRWTAGGSQVIGATDMEHNPIPPDPEDGGGPDVASDPVPPDDGDGEAASLALAAVLVLLASPVLATTTDDPPAPSFVRVLVDGRPSAEPARPPGVIVDRLELPPLRPSARPVVAIPRLDAIVAGRPVVHRADRSRAVRGVASRMGAGYGRSYLALPGGPGIHVVICALRCLAMTSTDAGPSLSMQRAGRIADLNDWAWAYVSGLPPSRGLAYVTVEYL
jgi:hypothetical protein